MTDYQSGDSPVPLGVLVEYNRGRVYEVVGHQLPESHPSLGFLQALGAEMDETYPDGVAYSLWPVGVPKKFGNRNASYHYVRRTSFTVVKELAQEDGESNYSYVRRLGY